MIAFKESIRKAGFYHQTGQSLERSWIAPPDPTVEISFPLQFAKTGFSRWQKGAGFAREEYSSLGIELVTAGNVSYTFKGRTYTVEAGSAFLKLPGHGHRYETGPAGFLHKRFINMHGANLQVLVDMTGLSDTPVIHCGNIRGFVQYQREVMALVSTREAQFSIKLAAIMYRLLLQCSLWSSAEKWPLGLREAVNFMNQNVKEVLSVESMAKVAKVSVPSLFRAFQQQFGVSPQKYFRGIKMHLAADMLKHSTMSIKSIAYELGYENPFAFSTQFRKTIGNAPRYFRKHMLPDYIQPESKS